MQFFFKNIIYVICVIWLQLKWSSFNPWAIAYYNLAWDHYTKTPMYKERMALSKELKAKYNDDYLGNYAYHAFIENGECQFFLKQLTWQEKLKAILCPFSYHKTFKW